MLVTSISLGSFAGSILGTCFPATHHEKLVHTTASLYLISRPMAKFMINYNGEITTHIDWYV